MAGVGAGKEADSEAQWDLWYEDTFDRECPRQIERSGRGLAQGLVELWARHLHETVQAGGGRGFSRFNLWWKQAGKSIAVSGDWDGLVLLREWVFGAKERPGAGYSGGDRALLRKVATAHRELVLADETSERIAAAARACGNRRDFEEFLSSMQKERR
jgi:hypothetical protein